jgi:hypothetical protein
MSPSPRPYQIGGADAINITKHEQRPGPGDIRRTQVPMTQSQFLTIYILKQGLSHAALPESSFKLTILLSTR